MKAPECRADTDRRWKTFCIGGASGELFPPLIKMDESVKVKVKELFGA